MNYWTIEYDELPSKGIYYPKDSEITIRPLTVDEVKYLATYNEYNAVKIVNDIVRKCLCLYNLEFNDIILADREYLSFWIRANSFVNNGGYTIKATCPTCNYEFEKTILCDEFKVDYIQKIIESIYLPDADLNLPIAQPKIRDLRYYKISSSIDEVTNIAMCINTENSLDDKRRFILNLSAYDYSILKYELEKFHCGMNKVITMECPNCHAFHKCTLDINDQKLFTNTQTKDILDTITRIAKYSNLQITNDWLWREVEIEQIIINDMIKKENEEHQKEMQKAKSKANAAMARSGIHGVPSI